MENQNNGFSTVELVSDESRLSPNSSPVKRVEFGKEKQRNRCSFRTLRKQGTETESAEFASTRSSEKERKGNALASGAEEGRDKLRKASGSCK